MFSNWDEEVTALTSDQQIEALKRVIESVQGFACLLYTSLYFKRKNVRLFAASANTLSNCGSEGSIGHGLSDVLMTYFMLSA